MARSTHSSRALVLHAGLDRDQPRRRLLKASMFSAVTLAYVFGGTSQIAFAQEEGQLQGEYELCSEAFQDNVLGDPNCRSISFSLPPSYWRRSAGGSFVVASYPVVLVLSGNNMYRNESTIEAIVRHRRRFMPADLLPRFGDFKFDQDGIAYDLMATGQTPEFILVEISGLSSYGGTRYDCSPIFGDMRSFARRDVPSSIKQRFRVRQDRDGWFLMGFSMGAGGALSVKLQDRENRWGTLIMLSPSNSDLSSTLNGEPALVNLFRNSTRIPQVGIPVDRVSSPEETAVSWGNEPGQGRFIVGSLLGTYQVVVPDAAGAVKAPDGVTPYYAQDPLTGSSPGDYDRVLWAMVEAKGLRPTVFRAHENLTDTVVIVARGNNKLTLDPNASARVVLHSEGGDQPRLIDALTSLGHLDGNILTQGDHLTALPHTFPAALKLAFQLAGSKTGRPFTFNSTIEREHSLCAAQLSRARNRRRVRLARPARSRGTGWRVGTRPLGRQRPRTVHADELAHGSWPRTRRCRCRHASARERVACGLNDRTLRARTNPQSVSPRHAVPSGRRPQPATMSDW